MKTRAQAIEEAARAFLALNPAFRSKPVGAPHSLARQEQEERIAAEDRLRAALEATP